MITKSLKIMAPSTPPTTDSDDEEDDAFLMEAAEQWATQTHNDVGDEVDNKESKNDRDNASDGSVTEGKEKKKKSKKSRKEKKITKIVDGVKTKKNEEQSATTPATTPSLQLATPQKFSLHLTKIPYTATQSTIRFAFLQKGCHVTSIRLVYDTNQSTGEKHFRGVAFVDLADEISFQKGLEFHQTAFLGGGRKVNVRVTKSKGELSEIVKRTEQKVADLIARSKEKKEKEKSDHGKDGENFKVGKGGNRAGKKRKFEERKSGGEVKRSDIDDRGDGVGGEKSMAATALKASGDEKGPKQKNRRKKERNEEEKPKVHKKHDSQSSKGVEQNQGNSDNTSTVKSSKNSIESKKANATKSGKAAMKSPTKEGKAKAKTPRKSSKSTKEKVKLTKKQRAKKAAVIRSNVLKSKR
mmetsp:Transcript_14696/g.30888  ORF Transcript_14696/g.30888 Transcript_14696/m.30888 type:complete len:411 (-) Transcript_14696:83-1315(-)